MSDPFGPVTEDYSDLDSFGDQFKPQPAFRPGLDALADGDYTFEIVDAALARATNGDRVLNLGVRPNGGATYQYTYWLNKQEAINGLGADLVTLGIDASKWGRKDGPLLGKAIPDAVAKLPGIRFAGAKRQSPSKTNNKVYHNLYINARVKDGATGPAGPPPPTKHFDEFAKPPVTGGTVPQKSEIPW